MVEVTQNKWRDALKFRFPHTHTCIILTKINKIFAIRMGFDQINTASQHQIFLSLALLLQKKANFKYISTNT